VESDHYPEGSGQKVDRLEERYPEVDQIGEACLQEVDLVEEDWHNESRRKPWRLFVFCCLIIEIRRHVVSCRRFMSRPEPYEKT
jgi:hypothetical protein